MRVPSSSGPSSDESPDIDMLAKMLSERAAQMRSDMDDAPPQEQQPEPSSSGSAGALDAFASALTPEAELAVSQQVGPGGFVAEDFQLLQELGRLSVQQVSTAGGAPKQQQAAVVAWSARYRSGLPYQSPVTVMLKEYVATARAVAWNEIAVMQRMVPMPSGDKWQAASDTYAVRPDRPQHVVPLLGYFLSPPSDVVYSLTGSNADSLWLVYKWGGLRPSSLLLQMPAPQPASGLMGLLKTKEAAEAEAWDQRRRYLRAWARGVLEALAYCHDQGVAHGSISPGSVQVSSVNDADADALVVCLSSFGFAQLTGPSGAGSPLADIAPQLDSLSTGHADATVKRDLQAAALLLAEVFSAGLAGTEGGWLDASALQRLLFDVFHEEAAQFKEYCLEDPALVEFVRFMDADDAAGWELLTGLMAGDVPAHDLLQSRFFVVSVQ